MSSSSSSKRIREGDIEIKKRPRASEEVQQQDDVSSDDSDDNADLGKESDSEDDVEIENPKAVPIMLLEMAEQLHSHESDSEEMSVKAVAALEKAKAILFHLEPDIKTMFDKARAKMLAGKMQGKVPPGSSEVVASRLNSRYLLSLIYTMLARISAVTHLNESNEETILLLREALICYPRSIEANYLLSRALRANASDAPLLEEVEQHLKKASTFVVAGDAEEVQKCKPIQTSAREALSLLLLQEGKVEEAHKYLKSTGYTWRLARDVLSYQIPSHSTASESGAKAYVQAVDNAVPTKAIEHLQHVFRPESPFWREHHYDLACNASRKVGYFSYKYPFRERKAVNSIEQVIDVLLGQVQKMYPKVEEEATVAEWWVHSRPHTSGHQLHFDSDETRIEGGGTPQHPICSCILYLEEDGSIGGPTLVTDQTLSGSMASQGWMCFPKLGRLVAFDATMLHGVIPGIGPNPDPSKRRLTFMVGFWRKIEAVNRGENHAGPGQPLPSAETTYSWPRELAPVLDLPHNEQKLATVQPQHLQRIWEPIDSFKGGSSLLLDGMKLPQYTAIFQGF
jgi:hypothetical protein